jgi:hypothetical protein
MLRKMGETPFVVETVYANYLQIRGEQTEDHKLYDMSELENCKKETISCSDSTAKNPEFQAFIHARFPEPCHYEAC